MSLSLKNHIPVLSVNVLHIQWCRNWGAGRATGPPIFGRSVNPIQTGDGQIMPTITTGPIPQNTSQINLCSTVPTPKVFHLPASLYLPKFCRHM